MGHVSRPSSFVAAPSRSAAVSRQRHAVRAVVVGAEAIVTMATKVIEAERLREMGDAKLLRDRGRAAIHGDDHRNHRNGLPSFASFAGLGASTYLARMRY